MRKQSPSISIQDIVKKFPVFSHSKWLLYEFNHIINVDDIKEMMGKNWETVCSRVLGAGESVISFEKEQQALSMIIKNVYQRKPCTQPIEFVEATGEIECHFVSKIMEPRLVVFHDEKPVQMFLCAENQTLLEIPSTELKDGLVNLMAAYYVFGIEYPTAYKPVLYFLQDIVMDKDDHGNRPTRHSNYLRILQLSRK